MNNQKGEPNIQRKDMRGQRCGLLTVVKYAGYNPKDGQAYWLCKCDCGKETTVAGKNLRRGTTKSCGCLLHKWRHRNLITLKSDRDDNPKTKEPTDNA